MKTQSLFLIPLVSLAICACSNPLMGSLLETKTIFFDSNGGSYVPPQTLFKNEKISVPRTPVKEGYFFGGWYYSSDEFYTEYNDDYYYDNYKWDFNVIPDGDMTLYAAWHEGATPTENEFSISGVGDLIYDGKSKVVRVTPRGGIIVGEITVYYEGIDSTIYEKTTNAPINPGIYMVTFDVTAVDGWHGAKGLYAGIIYIYTSIVNNAEELKNLLYKLSTSIANGGPGSIPDNPLIIPLDVYSSDELKNIANTMKDGPDIYITLDLSGSYITEIPDMAFTTYTDSSSEFNNPENYNGCKTLTGIILPYRTKLIEFAVFANCINLKKITIPYGVAEIASYAFAWCESLTYINLPDSVSFAAYAFYNCTGLTSINIPYGTTYIYEGTFEGCSNLNNITIPSSVTNIRSNAFSNCTSLNSVTFEGTISPNGFNSDAFPGDLREKYFETTGTTGSSGGPGTYTRQSGDKTWIKAY
jgi:hypothetical protein